MSRWQAAAVLGRGAGRDSDASDGRFPGAGSVVSTVVSLGNCS